MERTRNWLAATLVHSVIVLALIAVFVPRANVVFNQLLPALTMTLGYYFGKKS
jgi:roadblock/LC7 domain-containing protein